MIFYFRGNEVLYIGDHIYAGKKYIYTFIF